MFTFLPDSDPDKLLVLVVFMPLDLVSSFVVTFLVDDRKLESFVVFLPGEMLFFIDGVFFSVLFLAEFEFFISVGFSLASAFVSLGFTTLV